MKTTERRSDMSQQMVNGSRYEGSVTYTNRMSYEYAVVGEPANDSASMTMLSARADGSSAVSGISARAWRL